MPGLWLKYGYYVFYRRISKEKKNDEWNQLSVKRLNETKKWHEALMFWNRLYIFLFLKLRSQRRLLPIFFSLTLKLSHVNERSYYEIFVQLIKLRGGYLCSMSVHIQITLLTHVICPSMAISFPAPLIHGHFSIFKPLTRWLQRHRSQSVNSI